MAGVGGNQVTKKIEIAEAREEFMAAPSAGTKIVLQVGEELRIRNNGDIVVDNPELELEGEDRAADAVLLYRFDAQAGEHILRLLDPVADHKHVKVHRRDDCASSASRATKFSLVGSSVRPANRISAIGSRRNKSSKRPSAEALVGRT